jgi:hypothetical protein
MGWGWMGMGCIFCIYKKIKKKICINM